MANPLDLNNWYWFVGADHTQVYSSAAGTFVPVTNPTFVAWKTTGVNPTQVDSTAQLGAFLVTCSIRPIDAAVLAAYQTASTQSSGAVGLFPILFNHENRIRVLEGQAAATKQQVVAAWKLLF